MHTYVGLSWDSATLLLGPGAKLLAVGLQENVMALSVLNILLTSWLDCLPTWLVFYSSPLPHSGTPGIVLDRNVALVLWNLLIALYRFVVRVRCIQLGSLIGMTMNG